MSRSQGPGLSKYSMGHKVKAHILRDFILFMWMHLDLCICQVSVFPSCVMAVIPVSVRDI